MASKLVLAVYGADGRLLLTKLQESTAAAGGTDTAAFEVDCSNYFQDNETVSFKLFWLNGNGLSPLTSCWSRSFSSNE